MLAFRNYCYGSPRYFIAGYADSGTINVEVDFWGRSDARADAEILDLVCALFEGGCNNVTVAGMGLSVFWNFDERGRVDKLAR